MYTQRYVRHTSEKCSLKCSINALNKWVFFKYLLGSSSGSFQGKIVLTFFLDNLSADLKFCERLGLQKEIYLVFNLITLKTGPAGYTPTPSIFIIHLYSFYIFNHSSSLFMHLYSLFIFIHYSSLFIIHFYWLFNFIHYSSLFILHLY